MVSLDGRAVLVLLGALAALSSGCRGYTLDTGWTASCDARDLEEGRVRARRMPCDDESIDGGEGRRADYVLENALVRFVVRNPGAPLTLLGVGGGTVIDAAVPGGEDSLAELVPLVHGGWLCETTLALDQGIGEAAIHVTGLPCPLSFMGQDGSAPSGSQQVTVSYRLAADDRALHIEGHEGFWLMPLAGAERAGPTLRVDDVMIAVDGAAEDLGGGVLFSTGASLAVGDSSDVHAALWPGGDEVSGTTDGEGVQVLAGGAPAGWLPVDEEGSFAGIVPSHSDAVRALAPGHAPGPASPAGLGLSLPLGDAGWLSLRVVDRQGLEVPASLAAIDEHGRRSLHAIEPSGSLVPLGGGAWEVVVDAGPLRTRERVQLPRLLDAVSLDVEVGGSAVPAGWVLADLDVQAWPSRLDRRPPSEALALAAARGVGFAVVSAVDEVAEVGLEQPWDGRVRAEAGSAAHSLDQGAVLAWPVNANTRKPAHGAVDWQGLDARDILRVAAGSDGQNRLLVVDADWVAAAGPVQGWDPRPDLLGLEAFDELDTVRSSVDGWVDLGLTGPLTWVWLGHDESFASVDVERALLEGRTVASTGPLIELTVDGQGPGSLVTGRQARSVRLVVHAPRDQPLDGAALVVDGDWRESWDLSDLVEEPRLEVERRVMSARYVLAVVWGPHRAGDPAGEGAWAITSPVWTGGP